MGGDFDDVVGGVGVRFCEIGDDNLVDTVGVRRGRARPLFFSRPSAGERTRATRVGFDQFSEDGAAGFEIMLQAQHGQCNGTCFRTGKSHYADPSAARSSSNRDNGIVKIQLINCI